MLGFLAFVSWLLVSWIHGFLVSWFVGLLVYWMLGFLAFCFLVSNILRFSVSWFPGFNRSSLLGFTVSKFQGFKNPLMFFRILVAYDQIAISCLLIHIDLISNIFKILLDESSGLFGACLFPNCQNCGITQF